MGSQCEGCSDNKGGKCQRIGKDGTVGVCWMAPSEGEYIERYRDYTGEEYVRTCSK